jgi:hypothetical protein
MAASYGLRESRENAEAVSQRHEFIVLQLLQQRAAVSTAVAVTVKEDARLQPDDEPS